MGWNMANSRAVTTFHNRTAPSAPAVIRGLPSDLNAAAVVSGDRLRPPLSTSSFERYHALFASLSHRFKLGDFPREPYFLAVADEAFLADSHHVVELAATIRRFSDFLDNIEAWFKRASFQVTVRTLCGPVWFDRLATVVTR